MSGKKVPKKSQMVATRNRSQGVMSVNTAFNNNERSPTPVVDFSQPSLINDVAAGRRFLEKCLLFVPEGYPVMTTTLAAMLHQIAAIDKIPREAVQAIRAAAYLLDELDEGAIASMV